LLAILASSVVMGLFSLPLALLVFSASVIMVALIHLQISRASQQPMRRRVDGLEQYRMGVIDSLSGQTDMLMIQQLGAQVHALRGQETGMAAADDALHQAELRAGLGQHVFNTVLLAAVIAFCAHGVEQENFSTSI